MKKRLFAVASTETAVNDELSLLEPVVDKRTGRHRDLGRGAYGTVFECKLQSTTVRYVKVAVKVLTFKSLLSKRP